MSKKIEIKATHKKSIVLDHTHGTLLPRYYKAGIPARWYCRVCSQDITDLPLVKITYKKVK